MHIKFIYKRFVFLTLIIKNSKKYNKNIMKKLIFLRNFDKNDKYGNNNPFL